MHRSLNFLSLFLLLALSASCGGNYATKTTPPVSDLNAQKKAEKLNEALMLTSLNTQKPFSRGYAIGPEDVLAIDAYNLPELQRTVRVNSAGEIALPLVGVLNVKGMTPSQVEKTIEDKVKKYVEETVVMVEVKEYRSQRISVVGAVKNPQIFAVNGQRYLIDILLMAGGLSSEAGRVCYVIRRRQAEEPGSTGSADLKARTETIIVDLNELLIKGNFSLNIPLFADDIVNVPNGGVFFVDGEVNAPGSYALSGRTTLAEGITMAKGLSSAAKSGEVRIYRDNGGKERDVIVADYAAIREGEKPDILLEENDIIMVPTSGIKSFFGALLNTARGLVTLASPYSVVK